MMMHQLLLSALCVSCVVSGCAAATSDGFRKPPSFIKVKLTYFDIRGLAEPIRLYLSSIGAYPSTHPLRASTACHVNVAVIV